MELIIVDAQSYRSSATKSGPSPTSIDCSTTNIGARASIWFGGMSYVGKQWLGDYLRWSPTWAMKSLLSNK
ncbi:hypothetical protein ACXYMX_15575 [Sporosarcina sp. CAU 1771]